MKPRRQRRLRKRLDPWSDWKARGLTLPDDETLHRLSQPDAVSNAGDRLVPTKAAKTPERPKVRW